jgi:hypothetical protein
MTGNVFDWISGWRFSCGAKFSPSSPSDLFKMSILFDKDSVPIIGILGGGQLAMMMVEAAHRMGCKVAVLDPNSSCSAVSVLSRSDLFKCGNFNDQKCVLEFIDEWYAKMVYGPH